MARMARSRLVLTALVLVAAGCNGGGALTSSTSLAFVPVTSSTFATTPFAELKAGDCYNNLSAAAQSDYTVPMVDCDVLHDNEAFGVVGLGGDAYPGFSTLLSEGNGTCRPLFVSYVGSEHSTTRLRVLPGIPTEEAWAAGTRVTICILFDQDESKLMGSMRNSGE